MKVFCFISVLEKTVTDTTESPNEEYSVIEGNDLERVAQEDCVIHEQHEGNTFTCFTDNSSWIMFNGKLNFDCLF